MAGMRTTTASRAWPATPEVGLLLVVAAAAWLWTATRSRDLHVMPGAMGLPPATFMLMWALMVTAMMLPSSSPVASLYARSVRRNRLLRLGGFVAGYLLVWVASALPAWGLAVLADRAVAAAPTLGTTAAAVVFTANGAFQLTGLKDRCLTRCRSPFTLLLRYISWRGVARDLRAGAHSGAWCLGCCWSLMALMFAFGVMNLWAMVALTAAVAAEKLWSRGHGLAHATGLLSLGLAVAVFWVPWLAPGLRAGAMTM
jgi:predicted metal-binding membrane protein